LNLNFIPNSTYYENTKYFKYSGLGFAGLLLELSLLGALFLWLKSKSVSIFYSIQLIILFCVFVAIAILLFWKFNSTRDKITCNNLDILQKADDLSK